VLGTPGRQLCAGLVDHPVADVGDAPVVLGEVDEGCRGQQPVLGVLPAQEGLDCDDGVGGISGDDGLVVQAQLSLLQR